MKRRDFFRSAAVTAAGAAVLAPLQSRGNTLTNLFSPSGKAKKAKNIIFMVSDGMSSGTLNMANILSHRKFGKSSTWISLYEQNRVTRGMMDMASANSWVTDSAAASSSWGGGVRVQNGAVNIDPSGNPVKPILQKFKAAGKAVGCVTSVEVTHATPSGFSLSSKSRNDMAEFAQIHLDLGFDVLLGGGAEYFDSERRADKQDLFGKFAEKGYHVARNRESLLAHQKSNSRKPLLGIFNVGAIPYALDRENDSSLKTATPSLAEMTEAAIQKLNQNPAGFVMQVEGGKVDWAAHANDIGGLLYDQLAFDEAVARAIDFAEKDGDTLVIITTDHGNANPGLFASNNKQFERVLDFKHTNDWILQGIDRDFSAGKVVERIEFAQGIHINAEEAMRLLNHYVTDRNEDGLYNPYKLPFHDLADIQRRYTGVGWAGTGHSADYVEVAAFGAGKELLPAFMLNTDMHQLLLEVAAVPARYR